MSMNHPSFSMPTIRDEQRDERDTRLYGSWLVLMRVMWVVVVVLTVGLFIVSVPLNFAESHAICTTASCSDSNQLTLDQVHELQHLGLSFDFYTLFVTVLTIIFEIGYVATGAVIFWRKSNERIALVTSLYLVTFGAAFQGSNLLPLQPGLRVLSLGMAFVGNICAGFFFYLFPTGHFAPRWTRWLLVVWIAYWGYTNLLLGSIITGSGLIDSVVFFGFLVSVVAIQVYRYRRVSTPVQRQQTKWVVYGISVALVGFLFLITVGFELSVHQGVIAEMVANGFLYLFLLLIPLSIGIAMLRSRLFDIDVIINRTLVYGSLTVLLVGLYVGLILALQALVGGLTGSLSQQPLVIVASTLVIAALFQPLRRRLQAIIDHRFYRHKYDAAKVMAAFSSTLRNEVDLDQLREQLIAVLQETMQPSHVSLWVCKPGRAEVPSLQVGKPLHEESDVHEEIAGHSV
jgi:hypothetical protein